jgi:hypothetical protein
MSGKLPDSTTLSVREWMKRYSHVLIQVWLVLPWYSAISLTLSLN